MFHIIPGVSPWSAKSVMFHFIPVVSQWSAVSCSTLSQWSLSGQQRVSSSTLDNVAQDVEFGGLKVCGIPNSGSMWFYTIKGLFRVAFEYLKAETQRDCLVLLRDLWLARYDDEPMPETMELKVLYEEEVAVDTESWTEQVSITQESQDKAVSVGDDQENAAASGNIILHVNDTVAIETVEIETEKCSDSAGEAQVSSDPEIVVEYLCAYVNEQTLNVGEKHRHLFDILKILLEYYKTDYLSGDDSQPGIPFEILEEYTKFVNDKNVHVQYREQFGQPIRTNIALCVLCEWIGSRLGAMRHLIGNRVDDFKVEHIDHINNLPSPESLVHQLFPQCMRILLENWMGHQGTGCGGDEDPDDAPTPAKKPCKADRSAVQGCGNNTSQASRRIKRTPENIYPFIQLILEFVNSALVSGVAHVLYTRLLHDM